MKCPFCSCLTFYVKDSDDEYETYEFDLKDGEIVLSEEVDESECPAINGESQIYCNRCAWHGKLVEVKVEK
ncbi:MAG: hypothetical protein JSW15_07775 [Deltaproteobacteria bacterium]|nr:MAG: hypothetical protein JSW15_07775 [Deltaproteobacteria bacterium]